MLIPQAREKHLLFFIEDKQKQIPRFARDDIVGGFFSSRPKGRRYGH